MPRKCNCARNPVLDKKGAHLTCSAKGGYLIGTHNFIERDLQASTLNKDLVLNNNAQPNSNRKGDLFIPTLGDQDKGWPLLGDITLTHPATPSAAAATIRDP